MSTERIANKVLADLYEIKEFLNAATDSAEQKCMCDVEVRILIDMLQALDGLMLGEIFPIIDHVCGWAYDNIDTKLLSACVTNAQYAEMVGYANTITELECKRKKHSSKNDLQVSDQECIGIFKTFKKLVDIPHSKWAELEEKIRVEKSTQVQNLHL